MCERGVRTIRGAYAIDVTHVRSHRFSSPMTGEEFLKKIDA